MTTLIAAGAGAIPVGSIVPFAGTIASIPTGYLLCDGSAINRNDYADLFAVIAVNWGNGDGVLTFNLPTTQGLLLRGQANGSANDPDRASRTASATGGNTGDNVGTFQTSRYGSHSHSSYFNVVNGGNNNGLVLNQFWNGSTWNTTGTVNNFNYSASKHSIRNVTGVNQYNFRLYNGNINSNNGSGWRHNTNSSGSSQTVGPNVYVNYIIKF